MTTRLLALVTTTLTLASLAALPASAATLSTGLTGTVNTTVSGTSVGTGQATSGSVSGSNSNSSGAVSGSVTTSTSGNTNSNTTSSSDSAIMLNSGDSNVMNYSANGTNDNTDSTMVQNHDQLTAYAESTMHSDPNVQNVQLSGNTVSMSYVEPGNLFGFIPVHITANANVDSNGNITVKYPWYSFLVSTNNADLQSKLQTSIAATMQKDMNGAQTASSSPNTNGSWSDRMQADIMADMYAAFHANTNS